MIKKYENNERLLRLKDVLKLVPFSRATWWELVRAGKVPPGILIGPRMRVWKLSDIHKIAANPELYSWKKGELWLKREKAMTSPGY